jgi:DNA polymerase-3 subunit epsilon
MDLEAPNARAWQATFEDLGRHLQATTFVVLDLETTGGSPGLNAITEIGAQKIQGGKIVGEFQTLVNPGVPLPPFITVLTGITEKMLLPAPSIDQAFPQLLEFLGSENETVLVAHNARFDIGFLKAAASALGYTWPKYQILDTVHIARQILTKDEVRNYKLETLSQFFRAETAPTHRALDDVKATVSVLHGLIERLGSFGIFTLEELKEFSNRVTKAQSAKKHLAANIPNAPGVYIFKDSKGEPLYVGTSKNLKARVRTYFTAGETRKRIREMITLVERIECIITPTALEAQIRELRLIHGASPRYNRRSRFPERAAWIKLTDENFPRLIVSKGAPAEPSGSIGPIASGTAIESTLAAIYESLPLRQCKPKITDKSMKTAAPCILFEINRCGAPCIGAQSLSSYQEIVASFRNYLEQDFRTLSRSFNEKMSELALAEKFEEAIEVRDRYGHLLRAASRIERLNSIARIPLIVAAKPAGEFWEFIAIKYGRLAGSNISTPTTSVSSALAALKQLSEEVLNVGFLQQVTYEEVEIILNYLEDDGIRLVEIEGDYVFPAFGPTSTANSFGNANQKTALANLSIF